MINGNTVSMEMVVMKMVPGINWALYVSCECLLFPPDTRRKTT